MKKIIYTVLGIIFLILGIIGLIFPIIPQVPFLIASLFFLCKASTRLKSWIVGTKIYKKYLEKYIDKYEWLSKFLYETDEVPNLE